MNNNHESLRIRLHDVFVQNPMSLTDLARHIGVSFNTLKKFNDPTKTVYPAQLCKVERFVLSWEKKELIP